MHHVKFRGSHPQISPKHTAKKNYVIHSCHTQFLFPFFAHHPNIFLKKSYSLNHSTFQPFSRSTSYPLPLVYAFSFPTFLYSFLIPKSPESTLTSHFIHLLFHLTQLFKSFIRFLSRPLILNKPLKLSIYIVLILDLSFSFHTLISSPYIKTGTTKHLCTSK